MLDFACGTGILSAGIAGAVKRVHAIDISSKMIEAARKKANEGRFENIDFDHTTLFDSRLPNESFDTVLAINVLHLIEDPEKIMSRIYELLKPGGMIITSTGCMGEKRSPIYFIINLLVKIGIVPNISFFSFTDLENIIVSGNFSIEEKQRLSPDSTDYFVAARKI